MLAHTELLHVCAAAFVMLMHAESLALRSGYQTKS